MNKKHGLFLVGLLSVYFAGCASTSKIGSRNPASHSWANYHWATTTAPFTLKVGDNLTTSAWKNHLGQASNDWNNPQLFGATFTPVITNVVAGTSSNLKKCAMVAGTTQVCNGTYGKSGWLGLASININGDHITQGTAKMNDSYFTTARYNNVNEKQHVMCQEIAHTFGLDHQSEDGSSQNSCMDYFSNTGVNATSAISTRPNAHDFEELALKYSHQDGSTTVAQSATSPSAVNDDPNSWGQFMHSQSHGQSAYYERIENNGTRTITHVYWTEERAAKCENCDHRFEH